MIIAARTLCRLPVANKDQILETNSCTVRGLQGKTNLDIPSSFGVLRRSSHIECTEVVDKRIAKL